MARDAWTVVKVGGSLFDLPDLRERLRAFLAALDADRALLVPGGGATADAIRAFDRLHRLGEEASHWLAVQAMSVNARFLHAILPETQMIGNSSEPEAPARVAANSGPRMFIVDPLPYFQLDEKRADHFPHTWDVTSDSLAVRAAAVLNAGKLILLKSVTWEESNWEQAAQSGIVDGYFALAMRQSPTLNVQIVNLRTL